MLAAAGGIPFLERRQDADGRIHTAHDVGDGDADLGRLTVRRTGDAHQTAHRLDQQVVAGALGIGPRLSETRDGAVNQTRIEGTKACVIEPVLFETAGFEVLHEHVAFGGDLAYQALTFGLTDVHRQRALVAVGTQIVGAFPGLVPVRVLEKRGSPTPRVVARARTLHLDDFGAEVAQQLGA